MLYIKNFAFAIRFFFWFSSFDHFRTISNVIDEIKWGKKYKIIMESKNFINLLPSIINEHFARHAQAHPAPNIISITNLKSMRFEFIAIV